MPIFVDPTSGNFEGLLSGGCLEIVNMWELSTVMVVIVSQIRRSPQEIHPGNLTYCWWKKSCTTWDVYNPVNNGIIIILGGAGFCPSTVAPENRPGSKRKVVCQPSFCRGYVKFQRCMELDDSWIGESLPFLWIGLLAEVVPTHELDQYGIGTWKAYTLVN